jgi:hypothetical protein
MRSREWVARLRVVEAKPVNLGVLPIGSRMALCAFSSKSALVPVFMTGDAAGRETHPGAIQILVREQDALRRRNEFCVMTGTATNACVLSIEQIACL